MIEDTPPSSPDHCPICGDTSAEQTTSAERGIGALFDRRCACGWYFTSQTRWNWLYAETDNEYTNE